MMNYDYNRDFKKYINLRTEYGASSPLFCSLRYDLQNKTETSSISDLEDNTIYKETLVLGYGFIELINIDTCIFNTMIDFLYSLKILKNEMSLKEYLNDMSDYRFLSIDDEIWKKKIKKDVENETFIIDKNELNNIEKTIFSCHDVIASLHPWLIDYSNEGLSLWVGDLYSLKNPEWYTNHIISETEWKSNCWHSIIKSIVYTIERLERDIRIIEKYKNSVDLCLNVSRNDDWRDIPLATRLYIANKYFNLELDKIPTTTIIEVNITNVPIKETQEESLNISQLKEKYKNCSISFDEKIESYKIHNICHSSFLNMIKTDIYVKKCENCGEYFIPQNRSDTLYCDGLAPQDISKTCKEYGARKAYQENLNNNASMKLYRNIYMAKQMLVKRNPDIIEYSDDFQNFKVQSKQWKKEVKEGTKTEEEYLKWLKSVKGKKGTYNGDDTEEE